MRSRDSGYLAAADILRVVCIGLIGWYHIWQQSWLNPGFHIGNYYVNLQQLIRNGYMMVDVLLVLSGFLLALPFAKAALSGARRPNAKEFYGKRFWRIFPSYILALVLVFLFFALPGGQYESTGFLLKDVFTHLTFTHNLSADTYFFTPLPGVLWTLGVEVQFYLLFPLIVLFYEEHPGLTCLLMSILSLCVRVWVCTIDNSVFWVNQLPCMLDLFACGMAAAWLYVRLSAKPLSRAQQWLMALIALLALCVIWQILYKQTLGDGDVVRRGQLMLRLPLGISAAIFLVCGCLQPAGLSRILGNPVTRFLSGISYNFYIWHQTLAVRLKEWHIPDYAAEIPNQAGEQPWQSRYTLLCFAAALVLAAGFTYLWEKPIYNRFTKQKQLR